MWCNPREELLPSSNLPLSLVSVEEIETSAQGIEPDYLCNLDLLFMSEISMLIASHKIDIEVKLWGRNFELMMWLFNWLLLELLFH